MKVFFLFIATAFS